MLTIGATYLRIAPNGDKSFVDITTQEGKEYYEGFEEHGYIYHEQKVSTPNVCEACSA